MNLKPPYKQYEGQWFYSSDVPTKMVRYFVRYVGMRKSSHQSLPAFEAIVIRRHSATGKIATMFIDSFALSTKLGYAEYKPVEEDLRWVVITAFNGTEE
jgi:hypothetical protein